MAPESAVGTRFDRISHTTVAAMTTLGRSHQGDVDDMRCDRQERDHEHECR
jgi:hypothetical protein